MAEEDGVLRPIVRNAYLQDIVHWLKRISEEERQAILARAAGSLSPEEADEVERASRKIARRSMNTAGSVLLDTNVVVAHLRNCPVSPRATKVAMLPVDALGFRRGSGGSFGRNGKLARNGSV